MSGSLVSSIKSVHVSLPRRGILPGWCPRFRAPRTWIVRIPLQDRRWETPHSSRRDADARPDLKYRPRNKAMRLIASIGEWLDERLQLAASIRETAEHPVPRKAASWFYVFGSAALAVFILQIVTGIMLALIYVPSAGEAWSSLQTLNHNVSLGWYIRALHGWGSGIGASIASRVPLIGPLIVNLMLGGPIIAGATLSRFFALHVFVIPGLLIAFVAVHLLMALKLGINEW